MEMSIVIPLYNEEQNIGNLIKLLENQVQKDFELIIVDDGSRDTSVNVIKKIKTSFAKRILKQENSGPAAARNRGIDVAKGDLICFIDSDCMPKNNWTYEIKECFKDKSKNIVYGALNNGNKDFFSVALDFCWGYILNDKNKGGKRELATSANLIVRKEVLDKVRFDPKMIMAEDTDFSIRARKKGYEIFFEPEIKVFHKPKRDNWTKFLKHRKDHGQWEMYNSLRYRDSLEKARFIPKNNLFLLFVMIPAIWGWSVLRILWENLKHGPKVLLYLPVILLGNLYWVLGLIKGYKMHYMEDKR